MRSGTTLILLIGFGILILLIVVFAVSALRGTERIFMEVLDSHESYQRATAALGEFASHLAESKSLAEMTLRAARDLSMGLRPSILDDLGLGPALQWQAREFSWTSGIPVILDADGDLEGMPELVAICAYRVVQESLTNCARHAGAGNIRITMHGGKRALLISVQDDGTGFDPKSAAGRRLATAEKAASSMTPRLVPIWSFLPGQGLEAAPFAAGSPALIEWLSQC